ncbi:MAG: OmpA family protein, partial [Pseudomonadota bacterium]
LVATDHASQEAFDRIVGTLESDLPELFSLQAVLPPKILKDGQTATLDVPEFVATRSPEGIVQLRGRVPTELAKVSIGAFAGALFGGETVYNQTRIDGELPDGWPGLVLAGLEGLAELNRGAVLVQPDKVEVRGVGADPEVTSVVSRILAVRLGDASTFEIDVRHDPSLVRPSEPDETGLEPEQCQMQIKAVLTERQIQFDPGESTIEAGSQGVLDAIAQILRDCPDTEFEIGGHTDSQGSEDMNRNLSQNRADAVLSGLLARRVLISTLTARGYGEVSPIADNATEEGRALNRRIEFRLIEKSAADESDSETTAQVAQEDADGQD